MGGWNSKETNPWNRKIRSYNVRARGSVHHENSSGHSTKLPLCSYSRLEIKGAAFIRRVPYSAPPLKAFQLQNPAKSPGDSRQLLSHRLYLLCQALDTTLLRSFALSFYPSLAPFATRHPPPATINRTLSSTVYTTRWTRRSPLARSRRERK